MGKGILKRHESSETLSGTPDSSSKHVKWDEEKLKDSEAIKMTIPKGQIDEPKTPFQYGQYGSSCEDEDVFILKNEDEDNEEEEGGNSSEESFRTNKKEESEIQRRGSLTHSETSSGWESSVSEFEEDHCRPNREKFKSMRAQHYFMKQALERGKELIETEDEDESDD